MSTFKGIVKEFPEIRIDYFRLHRDGDVRPPLACFLTHIHSDHLAGLESLKSPFVYCSAATKEILLRLERYPHRMNFAQGILESRKQTYKHLKKVLRPIPLETPTVIELAPGKEIIVTLFDANHCTGAVMFLIEDDNHSILYTGDIRSEPWFVNKLTRSPLLVEYTSGMKTLDCIYLDTSNAGRFIEFPTKAEGLAELNKKVLKYPQDTTFHFAAWTFGYEEVWTLLSRALRSRIHVDNYKMNIYQSLIGDTTTSGGRNYSGPALCPEGSGLAGYVVGNSYHPGILTYDQTVRLHSCEKGTTCSALENRKVVWIQPIVCRDSNNEVPEVGIGGGLGDLNQTPELEIDEHGVEYLLRLFHGFTQLDDSVVKEVEQKLASGLRSALKSLPLAGLDIEHDDGGFSLEELPQILIQAVKQRRKEDAATSCKESKDLPNTITFPFSRHSSHAELCHLVNAFRPADVYPCTVNEDTWNEGVSIKALFGDYCSRSIFRHDSEMRVKLLARGEDEEDDEDQDMVDTQVSQAASEDARLLTPTPNSHHPDVPSPMALDSFRSDGSNSQAMNRRGSVHSLHTPLNPGSSVAITPSSGSQNLRRKAIEDVVQGPAKRIRSSISPPRSSREDNRSQTLVGRRLTTFLQATVKHVPSSSRSNGEHTDTDADDADADENHDENKPATYVDLLDHVIRCSTCHFEMWMPKGACEGCGAGEDAYEEHIVPAKTDSSESDELPSDDGIPATLPNNLMKVGSDNHLDHRTMADLGRLYMDFASSAYSSDEDERESTYEMNSMIDDASIHSEEDSREEEIDWQARYLAQRALYNALLEHHVRLLGTIDNQSLGSSGSDSEVVDHEGYEEGDMRAVEVQPKDPQLTEVVFHSDSVEGNSAEGDSEDDVEGLTQEIADLDDGNILDDWQDMPETQ